MKQITLTQSGTYTYTLDQEGEELNLIGRFKLQAREKLSLQLTVIHQAKHTKSHISIKAAVTDQAHASILGTIIVEKEAHQTESFLEEKVLLLAPTATAEAIPNLEINTNDVKCSHAATVGQVDADQLFYLTSRGIPEVPSKELLTAAFLTDTIIS